MTDKPVRNKFLSYVEHDEGMKERPWRIALTTCTWSELLHMRCSC